MYYVDLGYDFVEDKQRVLEFENLEDANEFANEVIRKTGDVLSITKEVIELDLLKEVTEKRKREN